MSTTIKLTNNGGAELTIEDGVVTVGKLFTTAPMIADAVKIMFQSFVDTRVRSAYTPDRDLDDAQDFVAQFKPIPCDVVKWDDPDPEPGPGVAE